MEKLWQNKVESILNEKIHTLIDTNKGLTNKNYRVITEHYDVIVRIPHSDSSNIVYRKHEALAHELIQKTNLNVNIIYFNPDDGLKIADYVPNLLTFNEYEGHDRIKRTANLMRRLHQLNQCIGVEFNPIDRYIKYRTNVKCPMVNDEDAEQIIQTLRNVNRPHTLCHNDWVEGNICFTTEKDYLIDYEYAGDNDPFFDVMSFITENELTVDEKNEFIKEYFIQTPTQEELNLLKVYEQFHNLLWCTWACMMFESRGDSIYKDIAKSKYDALKKV